MIFKKFKSLEWRTRQILVQDPTWVDSWPVWSVWPREKRAVLKSKNFGFGEILEPKCRTAELAALKRHFWKRKFWNLFFSSHPRTDFSETEVRPRRICSLWPRAYGSSKKWHLFFSERETLVFGLWPASSAPELLNQKSENHLESTTKRSSLLR